MLYIFCLVKKNYNRNFLPSRQQQKFTNLYTFPKTKNVIGFFRFKVIEIDFVSNELFRCLLELMGIFVTYFVL